MTEKSQTRPASAAAAKPMATATVTHDHHHEPDRSWADCALEALAKAGYRRGGARHEVVELLGAQRCALSPLELEQALQNGDRHVSRASVYRVLEELVELELVSRVEIGAGIVRYEPAGHGHHDHLVCDRCGRVEPFYDAKLEQAIVSVSQRLPFTVDDHGLVLHGVCEHCGE